MTQQGVFSKKQTDGPWPLFRQNEVSLSDDSRIVSDGSYATKATSAGVNTDNGPFIRDLLAAATLTAQNTGRRQKIIIPSGVGNNSNTQVAPAAYAFTGQLDFGRYLDLQQERGSVLSYIGEVNQPLLIFGDLNVNSVRGDWTGICINNMWNARDGVGGTVNGHAFDDNNLIGICFRNINSCTDVSIDSVSGFTQNIQFDCNGWFFYNVIELGSSYGCRYHINIQGNGSAADSIWNANKFISGNLETGGSMSRYGSGAGVRYSKTGIGSAGTNANIFEVGFQLQNPLPIVPGAAIWRDERFYNPNTFLEYKWLGANNTVMPATLPTHTDASNAGNWEYKGPCRRHGILVDDGGLTATIFRACRLETWFGEFFAARGSYGAYVGSRSDGNIIEVLGVSKGSGPQPPILSEFTETLYAATVAEAVGSQCNNEFKAVLAPPLPLLELKDLHLKAVTSAAGTTVPGFEHGTSAGAVTKSVNTIEILTDGIMLTHYTPSIGLVISTATQSAFELSYVTGPAAATNLGRIRIYPLDANKAIQTDSDVVLPPRVTSPGGGINASTKELTLFSDLPITDSPFRSFGSANKSTKFIRVFLQGIVGGLNTAFSGITLRAYDRDLKRGRVPVTLANRNPTDPNKRYSEGTPVAGAFLASGEIIYNLLTTSGQPESWKVLTTGYKAIDFTALTVTAGKVFKLGMLVSNAGTVYYCTTAYTAITGAVFATDAANFTSLGASAVLQPVYSANRPSLTIAAGAAVTLTAAQLTAQTSFEHTQTSAQNLTLDTTTNILTQMGNPPAGTEIEFRVTNNASFNDTLVAGDANTTIRGSAVVNNQNAVFKLTVNANLTSLTVFRL